MRPTALLAAAGALALCQQAGDAARPRPTGPNAWRIVITAGDRERLRTWRDAWMLGLEQARAAGEGEAVAREGVLLDPDAGLEDPALPDGDYSCRTIKLGRQGKSGIGYVAYPGFSCRMAGGRLTKLDGSQRPSGLLWPMDATRQIFLGAMALADESRALEYGRDHERDMVGIVERIGPGRWRLVLPKPRWESQLDVIEILPKPGGVTRPGGAG